MVRHLCNFMAVDAFSFIFDTHLQIYIFYIKLIALLQINQVIQDKIVYTISTQNMNNIVTDAELPKTVRPPTNFQKSKLSRTRSNALRQNRNESYNQSIVAHADWDVKSGCHFSCIENSMGIQIISSKADHSTNIQLCNAEFIVMPLLFILTQSSLDYNHY